MYLIAILTQPLIGLMLEIWDSEYILGYTQEIV